MPPLSLRMVRLCDAAPSLTAALMVSVPPSDPMPAPLLSRTVLVSVWSPCSSSDPPLRAMLEPKVDPDASRSVPEPLLVTTPVAERGVVRVMSAAELSIWIVPPPSATVKGVATVPAALLV